MEKTQLSIDWFKMHVLYRNFLSTHSSQRENIKIITLNLTTDRSALSDVQNYLFLSQKIDNL
jgi:hypothetical protein